MNEILLILLPGAMYFWVLFVGQTPLQEMLQERESQILGRLLACPVTPGQYVLAKLLRCFVLCAAAVSLLLLCSGLLFGLRWGNPLQLALTVAVWAGSMMGFLALIYACVRTREQANVLPPLALMLCAMVGGSMFPYENLPSFLQAIGQCTPNRWGALALQAVARAKPWAEWLRPLAGLAALGVVGSVAAYFLFQRQLKNQRRA